MKSLLMHPVYRKTKNLLWLILLAGLSLSSFPLLIKLTHANVAPFSAIPLGILLIIWFLPYLFQGGKLPAETMPLFIFLAVALITTALAYFSNITYIKSATFLSQTIRALLTLCIGLSFFFAFATWQQNTHMLKTTLQGIYLGAAILMVWSLIEGILLTQNITIRLPEWYHAIKRVLVVQSPNVAYSNRVAGFTFEPSWFVRLFNLVFLPFWLAATVQRNSIFKIKLWKFIVEDLLLIPALIVFVLGSPRIGFVALLLILLLLSLKLMKKFHAWLCQKLIARYKMKQTGGIHLMIWVAMLAVLLVTASGLVYGFARFASQRDLRFQLLFSELPEQITTFFPVTLDKVLVLSHKLMFQERIIYWVTGFEIFNDYPLGVGLGNAGFHFWERIPGVAYNSYEIRAQVYSLASLPNTKNLWVRLLAETGIFGFAAFTAWLMTLWRSARVLEKSLTPVLRLIGLAGQLFLVALLVEGFSVDSFAMPDFWVMTGLISSAAMLYRQEIAAMQGGQFVHPS